MGVESLRSLREVSLADENRESVDLRTAIDCHLQSLVSGSTSVASVARGSIAWREDVRKITQAVVEPDRLAWMDDDETMSDITYVSRALADIDSRFER